MNHTSAPTRGDVLSAIEHNRSQIQAPDASQLALLTSVELPPAVQAAPVPTVPIP